MTAHQAAKAEFDALTCALKRFPGELFEQHGHPAVLLDLATGSSVRVWGWWGNAQRELPSLLWCSERGWFATVVQPDDADAPGYELPHWSHRINLLEKALANAMGPHPSLGLLELHLLLGSYRAAIKDAVLWGILQLRAAHHRTGRSANHRYDDDAHPTPARIDEELTHHGLAPTVFKKRNNTRGLPMR